jgi:hypothetical protein
MIGLPSSVKIMLFAEATDMRKGFHGLGALVLVEFLVEFLFDVVCDGRTEVVRISLDFHTDVA